MSSLPNAPRTILAPVLVLGLLLAGCDSGGPTEPTISVTGVAVTAPGLTVEIGATLQLQATVLPAGVAQSVSWTSSNAAIATVSATGLVTGVQPGVVTITAASTENAAHSDAVQITVTCILLTQAMVGDGAVLPPNTCYRAEAALAVNNGTLAVGPGVRIEFGSNSHLTINSGGRLNATGTADDRITFTSTDPAGAWRGINFNGSRSADNVLHYTDIRNGGSANWSGAPYSRSAVLLQGQALADIQHTTITESGGQGITILDGSDITFERNTLTHNAVAAWVHPNVVGRLGENINIFGNTANVVRVVFSNNDRVSTAQTWRNLGVPFEIQDRFFIEAALTLELGVHLAFAADASVIVQDGGSLKAIGVPGQRITFRSVEPGVVHWKGLQIRTASANNLFEFVSFDNGGSLPWIGGGDGRAAVFLEGNSRAVFIDCEFLASAHYGLWVPAGGDITGSRDNSFIGNVRPMIIHANRIGGMGSGNTFLLNAENRVRVTFSNNDAVTAAQTWPDQGVPYYVTDRTFVQAALTIAAGTEIEFAQNARLIVNSGGSLRAAGTASAPVVFRGGEDLAGYWMGIEYVTASASNALSQVLIANAGSGPWTGGANATGSLHVTATGAVALSSVTFAKSGGYAIIVRNGGAIACTAVEHGGFQIYDYASGSALGICP